MRRVHGWIVVLVGCAGVLGCSGTPHFLEVDTGGGVLAMPSNSNSWPGYYRDNADKMLKSRFPNGYTIVKEEEVVVGVSSSTTGQTQTDRPPSMLVGGSSKPGGFAGVAVPLGQTHTTHEETTTYHAQTEWHMVVRANGPAGPGGAVPMVVPASAVANPNPAGQVIPAGATNVTGSVIGTGP
jgi:hypothetical protein